MKNDAKLAAVLFVISLLAASIAFASKQDDDSSSDSTAQTIDNSDIPQPSRYIENPLAKKGLYKISTTGVYYYRENLPKSTRTASVRLGSFTPNNLVNPENSNATFDKIYGAETPVLLIYDYERPFFRSAGHLAWKLGTGLFTASGHGVFVNPNRDTPRESFTLLAVPISAGLMYALQFVPRQWLIPYAEAGGDFFGLTEIRSDKAAGISGVAGAPAVHFSLGARIPLGFGARSFLDMAREYGISTMYLTGEYRNYVGLSKDFDLTGSTITVGIAADY